MVVDKVGGINPGYGPKKIEAAAPALNPSRISDNIIISEEASRAAVVANTAKLARMSEDGERVEKLKEIKARLERGEYDNPSEEMLNSISDKLSDLFLNQNG